MESKLWVWCFFFFFSKKWSMFRNNLWRCKITFAYTFHLALLTKQSDVKWHQNVILLEWDEIGRILLFLLKVDLTQLLARKSGCRITWNLLLVWDVFDSRDIQRSSSRMIYIKQQYEDDTFSALTGRIPCMKMMEDYKRVKHFPGKFCVWCTCWTCDFGKKNQRIRSCSWPVRGCPKLWNGFGWWNDCFFGLPSKNQCSSHHPSFKQMMYFFHNQELNQQLVLVCTCLHLVLSWWPRETLMKDCGRLLETKTEVTQAAVRRLPWQYPEMMRFLTKSETSLSMPDHEPINPAKNSIYHIWFMLCFFVVHSFQLNLLPSWLIKRCISRKLQSCDVKWCFLRQCLEVFGSRLVLEMSISFKKRCL